MKKYPILKPGSVDLTELPDAPSMTLDEWVSRMSEVERTLIFGNENPELSGLNTETPTLFDAVTEKENGR